MATLTLQTARPGENPKNAVFTNQHEAYAEAVKAHKTGEYEMVRLLERSTAGQTILFDSAFYEVPGRPKKKPSTTRSISPMATSGDTHDNSSTHRISLYITFGLIGLVLVYAMWSLTHPH